MPDEPEPTTAPEPPQGNPISDLSNTGWWAEQSNHSLQWGMPGVAVVSIGPQSCVAPATAWFAAASAAKIESSAAFQQIQLILPHATGGRDYVERFKDTLLRSLPQADVDHRADMLRFWDEGRHVISETDGDAIVQVLAQMPERTATCICAAQRIRFGRLEAGSDEGLRTHTGFLVRRSTAEGLTFPHLFELLSKLLSIARDRQMAIVVLIEDLAIETSQLPEELRSHGNLSLTSFRENSRLKENLRAKLAAVEEARRGNIALALSRLDELITDEVERAHGKSQVYGAIGCWFDAWTVITPHLAALLDMEDPNVALNVALSASAAGEPSQAGRFLRRSLELGLENIEQLNSAALIAEDIGSESLTSTVLTQLKVEFPHHPITFHRMFEQLMSENKFRQALDLAEETNRPFEATWARLLLDTRPDWQEYIRLYSNTTDWERSINIAVGNAILRGEYEAAETLVQAVEASTVSPKFRAQILIGLLGKGISLSKASADLDRLSSHLVEIITYLARHPEDKATRDKLATALENVPEEGAALTVLVFVCNSLFDKVADRFSPANVANQPTPFDEEPDDAGALAFFKAVSLAGNREYFGKGTIPPEYSAGVPDTVTAGLGMMVRAFSREIDPPVINLVLQTLNVACKIRGDEMWDFQGTMDLLSALSMKGHLTHALNVAESILLFWPESVPGHVDARRGHAWSCLAEVYERGRQFPLALLHLAICFEAMSVCQSPQHVILLKHKLRLTARIFRDVGMPRAREFLNKERLLAQEFPTSDYEDREILTTEISCLLLELTNETPVEVLREMLGVCKSLMGVDGEKEWGPLLAIACRIVDVFRLRGLDIDGDFLELIKRRVQQCNPWLKRWFDKLLVEEVRLEDIDQAVQDLTEFNVTDDQGYIFGQLDRLLKYAIKNAHDHQDPELFSRASDFLSQPALSAARASDEENITNRTAFLPVGSLFEPGSPGFDERLRDYARASSHFIENQKSVFASLSRLPVFAAPYVAGPAETLVILTHDINGMLNRLEVSRKGVGEIARITPEEWESERFGEWRSMYPQGYSWLKSYDAFGEVERPDIYDVRKSFEHLNPQLPSSVPFVTVLPESDLFGFSFQLSTLIHASTDPTTVYAVAPSLSWLATVRAQASPGALNLGAWLGHPAASDLAVQKLKTELTPIVQSVGGQNLSTPSPSEFAGKNVAVVLAHGSRGHFEGFSGIDDGVQFSARELANWLGDCACVVLLVCNAGKSTGRIFTNETLGVVSGLLQKKVRAVLAPPAPLNQALAAVYLNPFLQVLAAGRTVAEAHGIASSELRSAQPHLCAWTSLQLFGDLQLSFQK